MNQYEKNTIRYKIKFRYPYLKSLVIQCQKVNYQDFGEDWQPEEDPASTFQFIAKDFLNRFPKMANLKIHIANQTPTTVKNFLSALKLKNLV